MTDWVAGIDLGGTKIEVGLIAPDNRVVARKRFPTEDRRGPASVVERIAACIEELQTQLSGGERVTAVGVCTPGPVDHAAGVLLDPPNVPGLHHTPLASLLSERLDVPVRIDHDAKATGLGEYHYGAGRGERSLLACLLPIERGMASWPPVDLDAAQARRLGRGQAVAGPFHPPGSVAVFGPDGRALGLGEVEQGSLRVRRLFSWACAPPGAAP